MKSISSLTQNGFASAALLAASIAFPPSAAAQTVDVPNTFVNGEVADADEVNANFQALEDGANAHDARISANELAIATITFPIPAQKVTVAKSGAQFTSIAAALDSITDAASDNPYLVEVAPGVYDEASLVAVPGFVHLRGSGIAITVIRRTATSNSQNSDASVVTLADTARVSDLTIENDGASGISHALSGFGVGNTTVVERVEAIANGTGGSGHYAFYFLDHDVVIRDSSGTAEGASIVNAGFGSVDSSGPFAQPRIERCRFVGNGSNSGFGMQLSSTAADVFDADVFGAARALSTSVQGITEVHHSVLRSFDAVMEQTGSAAVLLAGTQLIGSNPVGVSTNFKYVHCSKSNYDPVTDGTGSSIE